VGGPLAEGERLRWHFSFFLSFSPPAPPLPFPVVSAYPSMHYNFLFRVCFCSQVLHPTRPPFHVASQRAGRRVLRGHHQSCRPRGKSGSGLALVRRKYCVSWCFAQQCYRVLHNSVLLYSPPYKSVRKYCTVMYCIVYNSSVAVVCCVFALLRCAPRGHHAVKQGSQGFCLHNNAAVAARAAQRPGPGVLIVEMVEPPTPPHCAVQYSTVLRFCDTVIGCDNLKMTM